MPASLSVRTSGNSFMRLEPHTTSSRTGRLHQGIQPLASAMMSIWLAQKALVELAAAR